MTQKLWSLILWCPRFSAYQDINWHFDHPHEYIALEHKWYQAILLLLVLAIVFGQALEFELLVTIGVQASQLITDNLTNSIVRNRALKGSGHSNIGTRANACKRRYLKCIYGLVSSVWECRQDHEMTVSAFGSRCISQKNKWISWESNYGQGWSRCMRKVVTPVERMGSRLLYSPKSKVATAYVHQFTSVLQVAPQCKLCVSLPRFRAAI